MIDSSIIFLLKFNYKNKKEFYDKSIRKALFYSIDKEKISNILYKGITPWNNFVPKCFMINDITRKSLSFSINKAKEYYKRAKSNFNNISLKMIYANFYPNKEIALNIQYYWKSVLNIDLLLEGLSFEEYLYKVENNEFDICLSLLSPTFPSSICFYMNYLNFITEEYEEIYIENLEKFIEYGHVGCSVQENLENILYNELPVLPLFNGKSIYLQRETISGYKLFEDGTTYFKNIKKDRNNI